MPRPIKLFPYDPNWVEKFNIEAQEIRDFIGAECLEVHHIGSTSIPGMIAKEDLDILLVVKNLKASLKLEEHGFTFKGELNIPMRYFFSKNTSRSKINLHVCEEGHGYIGLNLAFRDYLRTHPEDAKAYSEVKLKAIGHPTPHEKIRSFLTHYGLEKNVLIKGIIQKTHYQGYIVNFCMHENEWEAYRKIKEKHLLNTKNISIEDPHHFHFCLSQGAKIIGIAHVEQLPLQKVEIKALCIDLPAKEQEPPLLFFKDFLKKWINTTLK